MGDYTVNRALLLARPFTFNDLFGQQSSNPDSKQEGLAIWARLKLMSQSEFDGLMAKAQAGGAAAQYQVGLAYAEGRYVSRDSTEAGGWFFKSADQGYPPAEGIYGRSLRQSNNAAAEQWGGAGQGRYRLAQFYMEGLGMPRDYAQAYFWFSLLGAGAAADAKAHLSAEQVREMDKLVKQWQEQHSVSPEVEAASKLPN